MRDKPGIGRARGAYTRQGNEGNMPSPVPAQAVLLSARAAQSSGPAPSSALPPLPHSAASTPQPPPLGSPPKTPSSKFSTRVVGARTHTVSDAPDIGADFIPGPHETTIRAPAAPNDRVSAEANAPASQPATTTTAATTTVISNLQTAAAPPIQTATSFRPRTSSLLAPVNLPGTNRRSFVASDRPAEPTITLTSTPQQQEYRQEHQEYELEQQLLNTTSNPFYHHHHPQLQPQRQGRQQPQSSRDYDELFFPDSSNSAGNQSSPPFDDDHDAYYQPASSLSLSPPQFNSRHVRSNSTAGIDDGSRTLNRWSLSSASTRRQSIDSVVLHAQISAQYQSLASAARGATPTRKLQKQRPTPTSSPGPSRARRASPSPAPIAPFASLPPIVALPPLEAEIPAPPASPPLEVVYPPRRESLLVTSHEIFNSRLLSTSGNNNTHQFASNGRRASVATMMYVERNGSGVPPPQLQQQQQQQAQQFQLQPQQQQQQQQPPPHQKGHTRSRSHANGSNDTSASRGSKDRSSRQPSQKAMLSQALEKANAAVQLDNSRNFTGARFAYAEACDLLHQVLQRTNGEDDRKKLEAISKTYTTRIQELDDTLPRERTTPPRRPSRSQNDGLFGVNEDTDDEPAMMTTATAAFSQPTSSHRRELSGSRSANSSNMSSNPTNLGPFSGPSSQYSPQATLQPPQRKPPAVSDMGLMPPPLSPRWPPSPSRQPRMATPDGPFRADFSMAAANLAPGPQPDDVAYARGHMRTGSHESVSWLDPIDESGGSNAPSSSNHSRSSSMGVRRRHIRNPSGATEAEFDAALDDAIEAAYDDGYEVVDERKLSEDQDDVVTRALRRVEVAKERVRQSELEAMQLANDREQRLREQLQMEDESAPENFLDANDSEDEEEERILAEITNGYVMEDFSFGPGGNTRSNAPRASESSETTSRTLHTPTGSATFSEATTITPTADSRPRTAQPPMPPPTQALPQLPPQRPGSSGGRLNEARASESVRSRRLSGQNAKQLSIETSRKLPVTTGPSTAGTMYFAETPTTAQMPQPPMPKTAGYIAQQRQALTAGARYKQAPSPTPPIPITQEGDMKQPALRNNFSSGSLRSMSQRSRNLSIVATDEVSDMGPGTPLSNQFASTARMPAVPNLPTPIAAAFKDRITSGGTGGLYLFDGAVNDGHLSPVGSPTSVVAAGSMPDAPAPLEPCPTGTMLRPFWLMRCLFQTLAHPRGGYLSNKLFVPRDVWKVKGVKLKNVEDKISNCDLLTAALQKLGRVDTCDADAMLEEMQSLESIFEQVQANLTRRLGNSEVGVQSMAALFRDGANGSMGAGSGLDPDSAGPVPRSGSVSGKSSFSWRRLRSKNSTPGLNGGPGGYRKDSPATLMMDSAPGVVSAGGVTSLPMTSHPTSRPSKRDLSAVQFSGPNASYMASLAKLFDAAQAIDQIARQVEDPGLRHADKTQVGLELCTRHAAEFFAFYICRFVLTDLTILLDKFVKRGSEWVLV